MTDVAFCRPLIRGVQGGDVIAHKRAVSRWDPHVYPWGQFTDFYGPYFETAVQEFQRQHGIAASGRIGKRTHDALVVARAKQGGPAFDARAVELAALFCREYTKTPEQRVREAILAAGYFWYSHRAQIAYSQTRPMSLIEPPGVPPRWDCSGFVTACHHAGGAPDPNGRGYDGQGYTGTLASHGTRVPAVTDLQPGDLIFYGFSSGSPGFQPGDPTHVALYVGLVDGRHSILSLGHYPMSLYPYNYRGINHYRKYAVV